MTSSEKIEAPKCLKFYRLVIQHSHWKLLFIVSFPIKNDGSFQFVMWLFTRGYCLSLADILVDWVSTNLGDHVSRPYWISHRNIPIVLLVASLLDTHANIIFEHVHNPSKTLMICPFRVIICSHSWWLHHHWNLVEFDERFTSLESAPSYLSDHVVWREVPNITIMIHPDLGPGIAQITVRPPPGNPKQLDPSAHICRHHPSPA